MRINEKEGAEGTLWRELWGAYIEATKSLWSKFPEVLAGGFYLISPYHSAFGLKTKMRNCILFIQFIILFVLHPLKLNFTFDPCDAVIFCSSTKPSIQESMLPLVARLVKRGYRCAVITSSNMYIWVADVYPKISITTIVNFRKRLTYGYNRVSSFKIFCRALLITAILYAQIIRKHPLDFTKLLHNPLKVLYMMMMSSHKLSVAGDILRQLKPRLMVTMQERLPIAAELLLSKEADKFYKILYHYEEPMIFSAPIISQEVCVWNQTMIDELLKVSDRTPTYTIVGSQEISNALINTKVISSGDKPVFLYLSQFGQLNDGFTEAPREAMSWIEYAAKECSDWYFVIKRRAFHYDVVDPGAEKLKYDNVFIPDEKMDFNLCMRWSNVAVVGSIYSMGLFTVAGIGKESFRLLVPHRTNKHPIIDEISTPVHSKEELVKLLKNFTRGKISMKDLKEDSRFPYRGQTLNRMESLCLKHLGNKV